MSDVAKAGHRSALRRFDSAEIDSAYASGLKPDHPALREARTIFPTTRVGSMESQRFLVSGHNNPKLGKAVLKGPRTGWPIFHVTLEERATCPSSCHAWATCYGNAMPFARRHMPDADFLPLLRAEVVTLARAHPGGLLIRLHALGDFYSTAYVELWVELLAKLPQLHVFGYTARREDADDAESRKIAKIIRLVSTQAWERFSIRFSRSEPGPQRSIVVDEDPGLPDIIVCPAQTKQTEACATCGLCWAPNAREKTIAFLRHGMTTRREPRTVSQAPEPKLVPLVAHASRPKEPVQPSGPLSKPPSELVRSQMQAVVEAVRRAGGWLQTRRANLAALAGVPNGSLFLILGHLTRSGQLVIDTISLDQPAIYRLPDVPKPLGAAIVDADPDLHFLQTASTPAPREEEPPLGNYATRVDRDAIADAIMGALDEMLGLWPQTLDAGKIATHLGLQHHNIYPILKALHRAGKLQYVQRQDSNQVIVLPLGASMPHPELTQRQQAVFDFLVSKADADGIVAASYRTLEQGTGFASATDVLWALQKKGYIEVIHKGDAHNAATYAIPEEHRRKPIAEAAPVPAPVAPKSETAPPKPAVRLPAVFVPRTPKVIPIEVEEIEGPAGNRQLSRLRFGQCKWPLDDPGPGKMNEAMFCAEPCGEHTYCGAHAQIAGAKYARQSTSETQA